MRQEVPVNIINSPLLHLRIISQDICYLVLFIMIQNGPMDTDSQPQICILSVRSKKLSPFLIYSIKLARIVLAMLNYRVILL